MDLIAAYNITELIQLNMLITLANNNWQARTISNTKYICQNKKYIKFSLHIIFINIIRIYAYDKVMHYFDRLTISRKTILQVFVISLYSYTNQD